MQKDWSPSMGISDLVLVKSKSPIQGEFRARLLVGETWLNTIRKQTTSRER